MKTRLLFALVLLGASVQFSALAQGTAPAAQPTSRVVEDGGSGMYPAVMKAEASLPTHTIFVPQDLKMFDQKNKLPILAWGNGGCANSSSGHINFLSELASHGFIIIAIGPMPEPRQAPAPGQGGPTGQPGQGGPGGQMGQGGARPPMGQGGPGGQMGQGGARPMPQGAGQPAAAAQPETSQLLDAINWAIAQNADKNSPYYQKLDVSKIAVSGMSCGGLQAMEVANDPRVSTVIICNSGIINGGGGSMGGTNVSKEQLKKLHTPILYLLGGETDIAYANGMDDFKQINNVPAFVANMLNVGHGGTYMQPHGGEFAILATAWLKWQLKGDKEASKLFVGNPNGLSKNSKWVFEKKNID